MIHSNVVLVLVLFLLLGVVVGTKAFPVRNRLSPNFAYTDDNIVHNHTVMDF